jgi:hypothetical protein
VQKTQALKKPTATAQNQLCLKNACPSRGLVALKIPSYALQARFPHLNSNMFGYCILQLAFFKLS